MSDFVELLYRQLSISCLWFLVKYDILIIVMRSIYSLLIKKAVDRFLSWLPGKKGVLWLFGKSRSQANIKKHYVSSIKNRCPGYLQAKAKQLFESTGGMYVEVPILYRASQYDHTSDNYIPKRLSQRMYQKKSFVQEKRLWIPVFVPFNFIAPGIWLSIHLGDLVAQRTRMWRFSSIESTQMWS